MAEVVAPANGTVGDTDIGGRFHDLRDRSAEVSSRLLHPTSLVLSRANYGGVAMKVEP